MCVPSALPYTFLSFITFVLVQWGILALPRDSLMNIIVINYITEYVVHGSYMYLLC